MKIQLLTIPNPKLYQPSKPVDSFDKSLLKQIELMKEFLKSHDGAGLAACQIGFDNQVIVVEFDTKEEKQTIPFQSLVNPKIVESSLNNNSLDEGCLSVPQIELPLERAVKIKLRAQNPQGKKIKLTAQGIFARILQHEIDHLDGIIFTEKIQKNYLSKHSALKNLKIAFFGSGNFAAIILQGLILLGLKIEIFTEKAKPSGREGKPKPTPVAEMAKKFGKKVLEIKNITSELLVPQSNSRSPESMVPASAGFRGERVGSAESLDEATAGIFDGTRASKFKPDLILCADFGQKIPENVLKSAKILAINIHPSLLPKYRGASPIPYAILMGEKETGVTIMRMTNMIDQGPILAQITTNISPQDTRLTLENRLSTLAVKLLFETLPLLQKKELKEIKQDEKLATLTRKIQKTDGEIDWQKKPEQIERQIRAFYPWPGSYTILPSGKRLIILQSHPGGEGLVLDIVQPEGGKPMKWHEFLRGFHGKKPDWFEKVE